MKDDTYSVKDDRSLGALISGLTHDVTTLVRKESELAKTEVSEKISQAVTGIAMLAIAAVVLLGGFIVLLDAAVYGLGEVLPPELSPWLAALIVGVVVVIIGVILLQKGRDDLKAKNLMPEKTIASVKLDTNLAKEKLHDNQWNQNDGRNRIGNSTDAIARG